MREIRAGFDGENNSHHCLRTVPTCYCFCAISGCLLVPYQNSICIWFIKGKRIGLVAGDSDDRVCERERARERAPRFNSGGLSRRAALCPSLHSSSCSIAETHRATKYNLGFCSWSAHTGHHQVHAGAASESDCCAQPA